MPPGDTSDLSLTCFPLQRPLPLYFYAYAPHTPTSGALILSAAWQKTAGRRWFCCVGTFGSLEASDLPFRRSPPKLSRPSREPCQAEAATPCACLVSSAASLVRQLDSPQCDVQIRAAWEARVSSGKSKVLPPPFDAVARRRLEEPRRSQSRFLDDAPFEPRLMKS